MRFISINTGSSASSLVDGFNTVKAFRDHFDKLTLDMANLSFISAEVRRGTWSLEVETSKKDLIELLARIEADMTSQPANMPEIKELAADLWVM